MSSVTTIRRPYHAEGHPPCIVVEHDGGVYAGGHTVWAHKDAIGYRVGNAASDPDVMRAAGFVLCGDGRWLMPRHLLPEGLQ